jgi:phage-related minor tail protein
MGQGFKMGAAFVDVSVDDNTKEGREGIGSKMVQWAGGLALGGIISKGIADNLEIGQSTAKLGAQLGATKAVSEEAGKVAGEVYRNNFGESIPAVNAAIASIGQNLGNLNDFGSTELKKLTESALGIADVFDQDVNEVVRAAGQLVKNNLAPDFQSAMDQITRGLQSGGNIAGDFLETINEYAPQFQKLGFDGATALGLLSQSLKAGARDTDVVADAFKEFGLRAIDTAQLTTDGYQAIGLNADEMRTKIAAGGAGAQEAMLQVLRALQAMQDPVAQNAAGVALFGTQWEDTMRSILPGMDLTQAALTDVEGATKRMNEQMGDTGAAKVEGVKRAMEGWVQTLTSAEGPLGDISAWVIGFGGSAVPFLGSIGQIVGGFAMMNAASTGAALTSITSGIKIAAGWLIAAAPFVLIGAAVTALVILIVKNWEHISAFLTTTWQNIADFATNIWNNIWEFLSDLTTTIASWFKARIQDIVDAWNWLGELPGRLRAWLVSVITGAKEKLRELVRWFRSLPGEILDALGDLGKLLWNAGRKILQGLWDGLKSIWNNVTGWISDIGGWIADLKGPIEVDMVLLVPQGKAIMSGLQAGLRQGFDNEVKPVLGAMSDELASTRFEVGPPRLGVPAGTHGALAPTATAERTIHIENLHVVFPGSLNAMSRTELRTTAEFLRDAIRDVDRSQGVA